MNLFAKGNVTQINFGKSMNSNNNNFIYSNSNNVLYPYDSFRPGNILFNNNSNENKSVSQNKYLTSKDFFKIVKRNNTSNEKDKNNILDGKSKSLIKINDIVKNK
jgi:hypothetical protein